MAQDPAVGFGLHLVLDEQSSSKVRSLWQRLDDGAIASFSRHAHDRHEPHVALTVIDAPPDDSALKRLDRLRSIVPKALSFNHLGAFVPAKDRPGALFLGVGLDRSLLSAYNEVQQVLKFERHHRDYALGSFVARCPLSSDLESADELNKAMAVLSVSFEPFLAEVIGLRFVEEMTGMSIPVW